MNGQRGVRYNNKDDTLFTCIIIGMSHLFLHHEVNIVTQPLRN